MEPKEKVSFTMRPAAKLKLEALKSRLRREGIARIVASESAILEYLILSASFDDLLTHFEKQ